MLFLIPLHGLCDSAFDPDDDLGDMLGEAPFSEAAQEDRVQEEGRGHPVDRYLKNTRSTLGYQVSKGTDTQSGTITSAFYLRHEAETLVGRRFFFRLDGKLDVMTRSDHRADARNASLLTDLRLKELYLQAGFEDFSIKLGQQIAVWGKADAAVVTDVVSPRDRSDFIYLDLEDSRIGQWMLSANVYLEDADVFFFVTPYPGKDREPGVFTRYDRTLPGLSRYPVEWVKPEGGDTEYGFRLDARRPKIEGSFMVGHFYANSPVYHPNGETVNGTPVLAKRHAAYDMLGLAATYATESMLFKMEAAYKHRFPLQGWQESPFVYAYEEAEIWQAAVGVEYNANNRYQMAVEASHRHLTSIGNRLQTADRNRTALYYTFTRDFLNETLSLEYVIYYHFTDRDVFHDIQLSYRPSDNLEMEVSFAYIDSDKQTSRLWSYRGEDRLTFDIRCFL